MTVYAQFYSSGGIVVDAYDFQLKKSISENNTSSSFNAKIENYAGRHANDFNIGNDITIYGDTNSILSSITPIYQYQFNTSGPLAIDSVNGRNGSMISGATLTIGKIGSALICNGSPAYVSVNGSGLWNGSYYTVAFWYKPTSVTQLDTRIYSEAGSVSATSIAALGHGAVNGSKIRVFIRNDATTVLLDALSTNNIQSGNWTHIAFVDSGGTATLYMNGVRDATNCNYTQIRPLTVNSYNFLCVGRSGLQAANLYSSGAMDDIRMYNYPLSSDEVYSIYNNGSGNESLNNGSQLLFRGITEQINFMGEELDEKINLEGRDYTARLVDRTVEPEIYTNYEIGSIVNDIITKYTSDIGSDFVRNTTTVLPRIAFRHIPVFDAVKQLADLANYTFYVDNNKELHFEPIGSISSNYTFNSGNVTAANFSSDRESLYNQVWVYGDRYLDGFKQTFTAGSPTGGSVFTLTYNPYNTEVTVSGLTVQPGNVQNATITPPSGTKYLVSFDDKLIIFTSGTALGNNVPTSGTQVIINYKRSLPIVRVGDNELSKTNYSQRNKVIIDKDIKDPETAQSILEEQLNNLANPKVEGNLDIKGIANVTPGNTAVFNFPNQNINNQTYTIIEANYNFNTDNNLSNNVLSMKVNDRIGDLTDTMKKIIIDIKKLQAGEISDNDTITRFQFTTGSLGVRQSGLYAYTRTLGSSFILGKGFHGVTGPTFGGILGSVVASGINFLGDSRTSLSIVWSGGFF